VTVFVQGGLFLLHLLGGTETNGAGSRSGFLVTIMFSFCGFKVSLRYTTESMIRLTARPCSYSSCYLALN
jgi:hypothetical protein